MNERDENNLQMGRELEHAATRMKTLVRNRMMWEVSTRGLEPYAAHTEVSNIVHRWLESLGDAIYAEMTEVVYELN